MAVPPEDVYIPAHGGHPEGLWQRDRRQGLGPHSQGRYALLRSRVSSTLVTSVLLVLIDAYSYVPCTIQIAYSYVYTYVRVRVQYIHASCTCAAWMLSPRLVVSLPDRFRMYPYLLYGVSELMVRQPFAVAHLPYSLRFLTITDNLVNNISTVRSTGVMYYYSSIQCACASTTDYNRSIILVHTPISNFIDKICYSSERSSFGRM